MKKILVTFMIGCMTMFMASCSDNTPRGVAQQAIKCLMEEDYKGYIDLIDIPEDKKEGYALLYEEKIAKHSQTVKIKSFEIVDEQVDEKAGTAQITVEFINGDGKEQKDRIDLVKNDEGKWKIKAGK